MSPILLIVVIFTAVGIPLIVVLSRVRRMASEREASVRQRFPAARMIEGSALFYGQESSGAMQLRGNSVLVLTDNELYSEMWLPHREFRIAHNTIQSAETVNSFLGKTNFRPILKVTFQTPEGGTDSMAWLVKDVEAWKQALNNRTG